MKHKDLEISFENFYELLNFSPFNCVILTPLILISPDVISSNRTIDLPSVDLPHPDSPTKPNVCPF